MNIGDLSGTDVQTVNVNLGSTIGGTAGDAAADTVIVSATPAATISSTLSVPGLRCRSWACRPR